MKSFVFILFAFFACSFSFGQSSQSGTVEYNGAKYPADVIDFNIPPSDAENIIKDRMKSMGFTPEKSRGFLVYRNVTMSDLSFGQPYDLIFKVDKKSRKQSDESVVSLITAKTGEIPTEKVKGAGKTLAAITPASSAGSFLQSFNDKVQNQAHNLSVAAKADEVRKAEKDLDKLKKDQDKLQKKINDLQNDLKTNLKDQETQTATLDALRKQLESLKANVPGQ